MSITSNIGNTSVVLLVGLLACIGLVPSLQSAPDRDVGATAVMVSTGSFWDTDTALARLEVYWQVRNDALVFMPDGTGYSANFTSLIRVRDNDGRQVGQYERRRTVTVDNVSRTASPDDFRTYQANFLVKPGKYKIQFLLEDGNSQRVLNRQLEVKANNLEGKRPRMSSIELVNMTSSLGDKPSAFDKGNLMVVPSLTGEYGERQNQRLRFYFEVYRGRNQAGEVFIETAIRKDWGGLAYRDSLTLVLNDPVERQLREISLGGMGPGEYELEVRLRDKRHKKIAERKTVFSVEWSTEALITQEYETTLELLRLIAESGQLDQLKAAETTEERRAALDSFWMAWDPSPGSETNETRHEFYRRVKLANRNFNFMRTPGWRTDRGKIFIKHGEPDEIDDFPMAMDSHPYQEWHYHRSGIYRRFTFVDENGDGDYRLVYPYDGLYYRPDF